MLASILLRITVAVTVNVIANMLRHLCIFFHVWVSAAAKYICANLNSSEWFVEFKAKQKAVGVIGNRCIYCGVSD